MARPLQYPHDSNSEHQRTLAPQWMTDHHDSSNINSVLVEKGSTKRPSDDAGGQRHDKSTWRAEERPSDKMWGAEKHGSKAWGAEKHSEKVWGAADQFHNPQPDRFAPQAPKPARNQDHPPPAKGNDRWREDGQPRWGNNQQDPGTWGSPVKGGHLEAAAHGESWNRPSPGHSVWQRPSPSQLPHRADAGRWNAAPGKWDSEDHLAPTRSSPWEAPKAGGYDQGKESSRNGVGRNNFVPFGRGKAISREAQSGAGSNRWVPSAVQHQSPPSGGLLASAGPGDLLPTKLGGGPQKHKYTTEQLLSIFADLAENNQLDAHRLQLTHHVEELPATETGASLLSILNEIAQQMVEDGFATKAERRLVSRLNTLVEASGSKKQREAPAENGPEERLRPAEDAGLPAQTEGQRRESFLDGLSGQPSPFSTPRLQDAHQQQPQLQPPDGGHAHEKADNPSTAEQTNASSGVQAPAGADDLGVLETLRSSDEWFYQDPKGDIQGPYTREAIITWNENGYFPPKLPLATSRTDPHWLPLSQLLVLWKTPRADSFLTHQTSGQIPNPQPQSAVSKMLDAAETGNFSQQSSSYTAQAFNAQSTKPNQPANDLHSMLQLQNDPVSGPIDRGSHSFLGHQGLQMSHQMSPPLSNQPESQLAYQLQQRAGNRDLPLSQHLLSQQMSNHLGQGMSQRMDSQLGQHFTPPFSQHMGHAPEQNASGLSQLELQLQSLGLQGSRSFEPAQPYQDLSAMRAQGGPGADLLSRLQGHSRSRPGQASPAALQADPIVDLLGSMSRDSHTSSQNLAPIGPQTSSQQQRQRSSNAEPSSGFHLDEWMAGRSAALSDLPSQDLQSTHSGYSSLSHREPISASLTEPSFATHIDSDRPATLDAPLAGHHSSELRPQVDQVIQPKPKAPISAAVGPPSKKFAVPPPARLATESAWAAPEPPVADDSQGAPFYKIQKQRRREQAVEPQLRSEAPAITVPPARPAAEQRPAQEVHRGHTLGEAAGLISTQPETSEPPVAPWAGQVQSKGPRQKTLLEIQREEAEHARIRSEEEAAQAAAQAAAMPAAALSSWAKPLGKSSTATVTSFAEIQEQESRQRASIGQAPPPPPPAPQAQWGGAPSRDGKTLANRLSQSLQSEVSGRKGKTPLPRPQLKKPSSQPSQDDDELFWDPRHTAGPLAENHRNGSAVARKPSIHAEESADGRVTNEAEGSLSPEFADWCRSKLRELRNGDDDLNLILFLMTVGSNAEIAEYMTQFFGRTSAVAAFSNEFIKRKLVEQSGKKKGKKQKPAQLAGSESVSSGIGVAPLSSGATGWSKLPKKKKKGQKIDSTMLGFGTGTNYAALEKLEQ